LKTKYLEHILFEPLKKATDEQVAFLGNAIFFSQAFLEKNHPQILEEFSKDYPPVFTSERSKRWINRFRSDFYNSSSSNNDTPLDEFIVRAKRKMPDYARKEYEEYLLTNA